MITTSGIDSSSWSATSLAGDFLARIETVSSAIPSSENAPALSPDWARCLDAVKAMSSPSLRLEAPPNSRSIQLAVDWLSQLRWIYPNSPPTLVIAEPAGGIIVEQRGRLSDGTDQVTELTFYNHGDVEVTVYRNGRIESMKTIAAKH